MPRRRRMPTIDDQWLDGAVRDVVAADGDEKKLRAAKIVDRIARDRVLRSWAEVFAAGRTIEIDEGPIALDDIEQIAAEAMMRKLLLVTPEDLARVGKWSGKLFLVCRHRARQERQSSNYTDLSGMTLVMRRRQVVSNHIEALRAELGRDPTREETLASAPGSGSMKITAADLDAPASTVSEWVGAPGEEVSIIDYIPADQPDPEETAAERDGRARARAMFIEMLAGGDTALAEYAEAWSDAVEDGHERPHLEVARRLGASAPRLRARFDAALESCREAYREILADFA